MGAIATLFDFIINIDKYLTLIVNKFGVLTYFILFLIIFFETGVVIAPFLPGDSLLFVAGALAATGTLNVFVLFICLAIASVLGDTLNYWLGNYFGDRISKSKWVKKEYINKTNDFFDKHGGKTIIFARFIPIIRTFAPFVAGVADMSYKKFISFNIIGGILWVAIFLLGGFFFGTLPVVQHNLALFILIIIFLSLLPPILEFLRQKYYKSKSRRVPKETI